MNHIPFQKLLKMCTLVPFI